MKFLYIKKNNSGFKEYNFNAIIAIFAVVSFAGLCAFLGFRLSGFANDIKVNSLSDQYRKSISSASSDIENIEEQIKKLVKRDNLLRSLIGLPEIPEDVRTMGTGGESSPLLNHLDGLFDNSFKQDVDFFIDKVDYLGKISRLQQISYSDISD